MFSPALEAELEAKLGLPASGSYAPTLAQRWASIRAAAAHIALGEYHFWYEGRRVENKPGEVQKRLKAYWWAVTFRKQLPPAANVWQHYWSAAFVSYVLQQAGTDADFRYDSRHSHYVHWAIKNAVGSAGRPVAIAAHPVQAHPVLTVKPRVGDVICMWRESPITYDSLAKLPNPPKHPMHCDIVTEVEPTRIWAVGGNKKPVSAVVCPTVPNDTNTGCTVNRTSFTLTANGFLDVPPTNRKPEWGWIAVMRIGP